MVIGHNPQPSGDVQTLCGGRLLLTDTSMSVAYTIDIPWIKKKKETNPEKAWEKARLESTRRLVALETSDVSGAEIMEVYPGREGRSRCRPVAPVWD
mmetsp:Transcript_69127/g.211983  ORF Transcript_69127/g.211983 Transcript_69127/m.211983 type:complete len:97 (+) Transcript_69127:3-293(+)